MKKIHHEIVGDMDLIYETLSLPGEAALSMFVYTAEPGSASAHALRRLEACHETTAALLIP